LSIIGTSDPDCAGACGIAAMIKSRNEQLAGDRRQRLPSIHPDTKLLMIFMPLKMCQVGLITIDFGCS
jgi:hypothetical protein